MKLLLKRIKLKLIWYREVIKYTLLGKLRHTGYDREVPGKCREIKACFPACMRCQFKRLINSNYWPDENGISRPIEIDDIECSTDPDYWCDALIGYGTWLDTDEAVSEEILNQLATEGFDTFIEPHLY